MTFDTLTLPDGRRGQVLALGSTLIAALARQIGATVETCSRPGAGTTITVRMELPADVVTVEPADAAGVAE